eukprot:scaffold702_cov220-Chaetoceros_neogracile.AAC.2
MAAALTRGSTDFSPSGNVKATSADTQYSFKSIGSTYYDDGSTNACKGNVGRLQQAQVKIERAPRSDLEDIANPTSIDYDFWAALEEATTANMGTHIDTHSPAVMNVRMNIIVGQCRCARTTPLPAQTH